MSKLIAENNGNYQGSVLVLFAFLSMSACDTRSTSPDTLAQVNGKEITYSQIENELNKAGIKSDQHKDVAKKILESIINQQLMLEEAMRKEIDRTHDVVEKIEQAKQQIIAQAYINTLIAEISKPSKDELSEYYETHPEYFKYRKRYDIQQLKFSKKDATDELQLVINSTNDLDKIAKWMNIHHIQYARGQISRDTSELPEPILQMLKKIPIGKLFVVDEAYKSLINVISSVQDNPVSLSDSENQIAANLLNMKSKVIVEAEIARLRSTAKIKYENTSNFNDIETNRTEE